MFHPNSTSDWMSDRLVARAREALRLLEEREQTRRSEIRELRRKINKGLASLERGEGVDGEEFFRSLEREEQQLSRKRKQT